MTTKLTRHDNPNWVQDLAFEVALGYHTPEELQAQFDVPREQYSTLVTSPAFQRLQIACKREIDEQGKQFKVLARKLATEVLPELGAIALSERASHSDRISAINALAKYGGLTSEDKTPQGNTAFQVNINMGDTSKTITVAPTDADD